MGLSLTKEREKFEARERDELGRVLPTDGVAFEFSRPWGGRAETVRTFAEEEAYLSADPGRRQMHEKLTKEHDAYEKRKGDDGKVRMVS